MSGDPELPETEAVAAEHALGVLDMQARAAAEARMAADPAFAALVAAWRVRLAPLAGEIAPASAPAGLWGRIERGLPANDNAMLTRRLRFWQGVSGAAMALAAACLAIAVLAVNQPPTVIRPQPGVLLNASLQGDGAPMFVAAYDPDRKALIITSLARPGADPVHVHELWLIPADGKPRSLGLVEPGASHRMPMAESLAPMVEAGAALAVSIEPPGGSTKDGPSGPVAAKGILTKI